MNRWNRDAVERAAELLEEVVSEIPVYHLRCTISEEAVTCLEEAVYRSIDYGREHIDGR